MVQDRPRAGFTDASGSVLHRERARRPGARRELLSGDWLTVGDRCVEPQPVADHDQRGAHRRAEVADEPAHELFELVLIDLVSRRHGHASSQT
jgi:hypothetical protein